MISYLFALLLSLLFLGVSLVKGFLKIEDTNSLLFLLLGNLTFILSTTLFTFYFQNKVLAFLSSLFLFVYAILILKELKRKNQSNSIFEIPYFFFTILLVLCLLIRFFL